MPELRLSLLLLALGVLGPAAPPARAQLDFAAEALPPLRPAPDLDSLTAALSSASAASEQVPTLWALGDAFARHDFSRALTYLNRAQALADSLGEARLSILTLHRRARALNNRGDYAAAAAVVARAAARCGERDDLPLACAATRALRAEQSRSGTPIGADTVTLWLRDRLRTAQTLGTDRDVGDAYLSIARIQGTAHVDSFIYYTALARDAYERAGAHDEVGDAYSTLGAAYNHLGQGEQAVAYLREAYAHYDSLSVRGWTAYTQQLTGRWNFDHERYGEALEPFERSEAAYAAIGSEGAARMLRHLTAKTHLELGDFETARGILDERLAGLLADSVPNFGAVVETRVDLGRAYRAAGMPGEAAGQLSLAAALLDERPGLRERGFGVMVERLAADLAADAGDVGGVEEHLLSAKAYAAGDPVELQTITRALADHYARSDRYAEAFAALAEHDRLQDTLARQSEAAATTRAQTLFGVREMEYAVADLEHRGALADAEAGRQRTRFLAAILGVALLVVVAGLLWRQTRQRRRSNEELRARNAEIALLLREIHHRARNNLSIVEGLLDAQADDAGDEGTREALATARGRLLTVRLIHQQLFRDGGDAGYHLDAEVYLGTLVDRLAASLAPAHVTLDAALDAEHLALDLDAAVPLGLIVNEAITNALKYAFPDRRAGTVTVALDYFAAGGSNEVELRITDDGVGLATPPAPRDFTFLNALARQLGGRLDVGRGERGGTRVRLRFPATDPVDSRSAGAARREPAGTASAVG